MPTDVDLFNMLRDNQLEALNLTGLRIELTRTQRMLVAVTVYLEKITWRISEIQNPDRD